MYLYITNAIVIIVTVLSSNQSFNFKMHYFKRLLPIELWHLYFLKFLSYTHLKSLSMPTFLYLF